MPHTELAQEYSAIQSLLKQNIIQCARISLLMQSSILRNGEIEALMEVEDEP